MLGVSRLWIGLTRLLTEGGVGKKGAFEGPLRGGGVGKKGAFEGFLGCFFRRVPLRVPLRGF